MSRMRRKILVAAMCAAPLSVHAASYSVSLNQISNFNMWVTGGSISPFSFTFSNDAAALNNVGASNVNNMDAAGACVGIACNSWQNQFSSHTATNSQFSYGDALIVSVPTMGGGSGAASAIGETRSTSGSGFGTGSNSLMASFQVMSVGTQLHFDFDANLLMQTVLGSGYSGAAASTYMQISISGPSSYQFTWAPNGTAGGIVGGNEYSDPFSLNWGISGTNYFSAASGSSSFHAVTSGLNAGSYTMNITMAQTANVSAVPLPAAAWLLGSGLVGLASVARRTKS